MTAEVPNPPQLPSELLRARAEGCHHLMLCAPGTGCRRPACACGHRAHPDGKCPVRACGCREHREQVTRG